MPPCGLRPIGPVASLLGRSGNAADTLPPSRLATGQIGRNERMRIYEIGHLGHDRKGRTVDLLQCPFYSAFMSHNTRPSIASEKSTSPMVHCGLMLVLLALAVHADWPEF